MKIINNLIVLWLICFSLFSCEENKFVDPTPKGRMENVFFAKDTFYFSEKIEKAEILLKASKYLNYAAALKLEVIDLSVPDSVKAVEKEHFLFDTKQTKMLLGENSAALKFRIVNDTCINPNRMFGLNISSITGGGFLTENKTSCVVIIRNDDFAPEATVVFDSMAYHVKENCGFADIPFQLTMAAKGDVKVVFAVKNDGNTAQENIHFVLKNKEVMLPAGELKGVLNIEILNEDYAFTDTRFHLVVRSVEGAAIGQDSIVPVNIINDDLDRSVTFSAKEVSLDEYSGRGDVALLFEGGVDHSRPITGVVVIDSLFGCTEEDLVLEKTSFSTFGNETVKIGIRLKDNKVFGEWGAKLTLKSLNNVRADVKSVIVHVKDDERMLAFDTSSIELLETESSTFKIKLLGGPVDNNIRVKLAIDPKLTTAHPSQYKLPQFVTIPAGTEEVLVDFETIKHESKDTRELALQLTVENKPYILLTGDERCLIKIVNTDKVVKFVKGEVFAPCSGVWYVPLELSPFDEALKVKFEISNSSPTMGCVIKTEEVTIPAGAVVSRVGIRVNEVEKDPSARVTIRIKEVKTLSGTVLTDIYDTPRECAIGIDGKKMNLNQLVGSYTAKLTRKDGWSVNGGKGWTSNVTVVDETCLQLTGFYEHNGKFNANFTWQLKWIPEQGVFHLVEPYALDGKNYNVTFEGTDALFNFTSETGTMEFNASGKFIKVSVANIKFVSVTKDGGALIYLID